MKDLRAVIESADKVIESNSAYKHRTKHIESLKLQFKGRIRR